MSVNDFVVQGAEPLFFLDYFACGKLSPGSRRASCERDSRRLPRGALRADRWRDRRDARALQGWRLRSRRLCGRRGRARSGLPRGVAAGDVVLGLASSGLHSNGFSLARKAAEISGLRFDAPCPFAPGMTLGDAMLAPTRIYVRSCLAAIREAGGVKALAHITGGGFTENIPRALPDGLAVRIDLASVPALPVFSGSQSGRHRRARNAADVQLRHRHDRDCRIRQGRRPHRAYSDAKASRWCALATSSRRPPTCPRVIYDGHLPLS